MMPIMTDPLDDAPPPEELEMAVEEMTGKPFPGKPEERIEALQKRIDYLRSQLDELSRAGAREFAAASKITQDLAEARRQLSEFQAQHEGRN
jgi:hypothetical protein